MRKRSFIAALSACLLGAATPALPQAADGPQYNVEIIVFRTASTAASAADAAGIGGGRASMGSVDGDAAGSSGSARFIRALPASAFQLNDAEQRMKTSGAYRPLVHAAWTQTPSPWGSRSGLPLSRLGAEGEGLSGSAYLERGQYLHVGFNVSYNGATISEIRRVRLGEKTYFDNPNFGILAVVTAAR